MTTTLGAGNVPITLGIDDDAEELILKPSLRAAQNISRSAGGIMGAVQAVGRFEIEVITNVIALGLDVRKPKELNELAERVYATGITDLVGPVTTFLTILANGGRSIEATGGEGDSDPLKSR